jgi:hypothetical protein
MKPPIRNSAVMQEASSQTYQGEYSRELPRRTFSPSVLDASELKTPTVLHLTESGAQPPTKLAELLLVLPLLLALQKAAAEPK